VPFFAFCHNGVRTNVQHAGGVANATGIQGHIDNLLLHRRRLSWVARVQEKGAPGTVLLAAAVALLTLTRLGMADDIDPVTVGTMQDLENHETTQSCWGYAASETPIENSTSIPVRHLQPI